MTEAKIEFDRERASQYDLDIRKAIPGYEALHGMAYSLLQSNISTSARVLVVGSGTGMELISYCKRSQWSLIGVEPSVEMMGIAIRELNILGLSDRVNLHRGYIDTLPPTEPIEAATLLLVMHFLPDDGSKLQLLQNIARRLRKGAPLVLADLYGDRTLPYFAKFIKAWRFFYLSQLDAESRVKAEAQFSRSIANSVYFVTEARIVELLQSAGFSQIAKFYNAFLFGGWIARYTGS